MKIGYLMCIGFFLYLLYIISPLLYYMQFELVILMGLFFIGYLIYKISGKIKISIFITLIIISLLLLVKAPSYEKCNNGYCKSIIGTVYYRDQWDSFRYTDTFVTLFNHDLVTLGGYGSHSMKRYDIYAVDQYNVYCKGKIMSGIDRNDIKVYDLHYRYIYDKNNLYYDCNKIEGFDVKTIDFGHYYLLDKNSVYFQDEKIDRLDRESFQLFSKYSKYAFDNSNIYCGGMKMDGVDSNDYNYIQDTYIIGNQKIYWNCNNIKNIDINTFQVLNKTYSKDDNNVYYQGQKMHGVDSNTFEIFKENRVYAKDKDYIYYRNYRLTRGISPVKFIVPAPDDIYLNNINSKGWKVTK